VPDHPARPQMPSLAHALRVRPSERSRSADRSADRSPIEVARIDLATGCASVPTEPDRSRSRPWCRYLPDWPPCLPSRTGRTEPGMSTWAKAVVVANPQIDEPANQEIEPDGQPHKDRISGRDRVAGVSQKVKVGGDLRAEQVVSERLSWSAAQNYRPLTKSLTNRPKRARFLPDRRPIHTAGKDPLPMINWPTLTPSLSPAL
jgi:hypothetical protein